MSKTPPPATKPASAKAASRPVEKSGGGLPLRWQVVGLLVFFVILVAAASFRSTYDYLVRDKVATVREVQKTQVEIVADRVREQLERLRRQLLDAAIVFYNPSAGEVTLDPQTWAWVQIPSKNWQSPNFKDTLPPFQAPTPKEGVSTWVERDAKDPEALVITVSFKVKEAGQEQTRYVQGRVKKSMLLGKSNDLIYGPIKGVIAEFNPEGEPQVWLEATGSARELQSLWSRLPKEWREDVARSEKSKVRDWEPADEGQEAYSLSYSRVPWAGVNTRLMAFMFVGRAELLSGFRGLLISQGMMAGIILLVGIIVAFFVAGRMSRPIEAMVKAANRIATGDFRVRVESKRRDELGQLAGAFNRMGEDLEQRESALKQAQNALVQNEKLAALGTLSAGIAHEVKNPLAGILGHADLALQQAKKAGLPEGSGLFKYIETIQKETKRCRGIIDSLMRFSRQEKSELEAIDIELVAWEAIHLMEHTLNLSKVKVAKNFPDMLKMVKGNSNQIEQVLLNMLQNAGHAMPQGGTVTVGAEFYASAAACKPGKLISLDNPELGKGSVVRLYVRDTGTGMTEEVQRKIFEPFFTTKARGVGTGLGLSVTMGILGEHKARVSLDSAPGKGTAFFMDFPAAQDRPAHVLDQLKEVRSRKDGGQQLASDVSSAKTDVAAKGPATPTPPPVKQDNVIPLHTPEPETAPANSGATNATWQLSGDTNPEAMPSNSTKTQSPQMSKSMQAAAQKSGLSGGTLPKFGIRKPKVNNS